MVFNADSVSSVSLASGSVGRTDASPIDWNRWRSNNDPLPTASPLGARSISLLADLRIWLSFAFLSPNVAEQTIALWSNIRGRDMYPVPGDSLGLTLSKLGLTKLTAPLFWADIPESEASSSWIRGVPTSSESLASYRFGSAKIATII